MTLRAPQPHLHQGAIYEQVPIAWVRPPLWVMRPRDRPFADMFPRRADETSDAFSGRDGEEVVLALAKARPVVVLSTYAELRRLRQVRVVPLYSYRRESSLARLRGDIEAGKVGAAYHLTGNGALGLHDGALRLDQMQAVDSELLRHQIASMDDATLAALMEHATRFLQTLDRRPAA